MFIFIERNDATATESIDAKNLKKQRKFSIMDTQPSKIDVDTIDFFIRKAHTERSEAITGAFGGLTEMVKNIFTSLETGNMARGH